MARYEGNGSYEKLIETTMSITEWRTLEYSYADYSLLSRPFSFTRSGIYNYLSSIGHRSVSGLYWESGKESKSRAYYLYYAIDLLHIDTRMDSGHGISVRCVAKLATDSICPKGWEMARVSGNGSWENIIGKTYSIYNLPSSSLVNWDSHKSGLHTQPISLYDTGRYDFSIGKKSNPTTTYYWTQRIAGGSLVMIFEFYNSNMHLKRSYGKWSGFSVRCVVKLIDDI